jgi:hypothetical protein
VTYSEVFFLLLAKKQTKQTPFEIVPTDYLISTSESDIFLSYFGSD